MRRTALLLARLFLGASFAYLGWTKVSGAPEFGVGQPFVEFFPGWVATALDRDLAVPFWRPILEFVHGRPAAVAYLVSGGEVLVGACLLLGAFAPLAAIGGMLLVVASALSVSPLAGDAPRWVKARDLLDHASIALLLLVVAVGGAGRVLGLDAWLFRRGETALDEEVRDF